MIHLVDVNEENRPDISKLRKVGSIIAQFPTESICSPCGELRFILSFFACR